MNNILAVSSLDIVQGIEQILEKLQPFIYEHGGSIQFVEYKDGSVYVKLSGACVSCPISSYTLQMGILKELQKQYPEIIDVISVDD